MVLQLGLPNVSPAPYSVKDALYVTPVAAAPAVDVEETLVDAAAAVVAALVEAATGVVLLAVVFTVDAAEPDSIINLDTDVILP